MSEETCTLGPERLGVAGGLSSLRTCIQGIRCQAPCAIESNLLARLDRENRLCGPRKDLQACTKPSFSVPLLGKQETSHLGIWQIFFFNS